MGRKYDKEQGKIERQIHKTIIKIMNLRQINKTNK